jgi:hypothetical protein
MSDFKKENEAFTHNWKSPNKQTCSLGFNSAHKGENVKNKLNF